MTETIESMPTRTDQLQFAQASVLPPDQSRARFLMTSRRQSRSPLYRAARTRMASKLMALMQTRRP